MYYTSAIRPRNARARLKIIRFFSLFEYCSSRTTIKITIPQNITTCEIIFKYYICMILWCAANAYYFIYLFCFYHIGISIIIIIYTHHTHEDLIIIYRKLYFTYNIFIYMCILLIIYRVYVVLSLYLYTITYINTNLLTTIM